MVNPAFTADSLPTAVMRQAHTDWWTAYDNSDKHYQSSPDVLFSPADIDNWRANGSYTIARHGSNFLNTLIELIRTTGDPKALEELVFWSGEIRKLLKDHDGRGYKYFQYTAVVKSNPEDNQHNLDDTQWLDEHMIGGVIAHFANVMHINRQHNNEAGSEADFWFKYLDENYVPKWLYRTTYKTGDQYTPPDNLGLKNAVNWGGGVGGSGGNAGDIVNWGAAEAWDGSKDAPRFNDINGITHKYPAHMFAHSYIMSIVQYQVMGQYFKDTGKKPVGAYITGTAEDYFNESKARHDWWHKKMIYRDDGSTFWPHFLTTQRGTQRTDVYSMYVAYYSQVLHWMQLGNFSKDEEMKRYAKTWYNGNPSSSDDVYDPGNVKTMKARNNGTGGDIAFILTFAGLLGCWDDTGTLLALNDQTIITPLSHHLPESLSKMSTIWHHNIHHNTILSCELKNHFDN